MKSSDEADGNEQMLSFCYKEAAVCQLQQKQQRESKKMRTNDITRVLFL